MQAQSKGAKYFNSLKIFPLHTHHLMNGSEERLSIWNWKGFFLLVQVKEKHLEENCSEDSFESDLFTF